MGEKVDVVMKNDLYMMVQSADMGGIIVPYRKNPEDYSVALPTGIKDMVEKIIAAVGNKKISILRIWSHGIVNWILPDGGAEPNDDGIAVLGVDRLGNNTFSNFEADLSRLKPFFQKPATVELRGCALAKGTGKDLMKKLWKIWEASVIASSLNELNVMWQDPNSVYIADGNGVSKAKNLKNVYGQ